MQRRNRVYKRCGCRDPVDGRRWGTTCPRLREQGHGTWYFSLELPPSRDGRRQRIRRGGFHTRQAAEQARDYLLGVDVDPDPSVVTVGQWLDIWWETRTNLAFSTRRMYAQHIRDYLRPYLGNVALRELTTARVQAMFTALIRTRRDSLSGATLHRIRTVLHAALNAAIRQGWLERNPAHWVTLPSGRRPPPVVWTQPRVEQWRATGQRPVVAVWTAEQTAEFLDSIRGHRLSVLYLLVALLGLRRGEVAGLRWCDIDLHGRVLTVSHQVQDHNGHSVVCPAKTHSSLGGVALDHVTVAALRRLRNEQVRDCGVAPTGFVFTNPAGKPWNLGYLTRTFNRLVAQADLPPIRLHDLRHGAASLSLAAGNELKAVQAMLRHSSIVITADTYTSVLPCLGHQAAENTANLVLRAARRTASTIRRNGRRTTRRHLAQRPHAGAARRLLRPAV